MGDSARRYQGCKDVDTPGVRLSSTNPSCRSGYPRGPGSLRVIFMTTLAMTIGILPLDFE